MVRYKLIFLTGRGPAECARQLFALADQEYEDVRLSRKEFHAMIGGVPFGQLPVLEVDGKLLTQTMAINRFLARTFAYLQGNGSLQADFSHWAWTRRMCSSGQLFIRVLFALAGQEYEDVRLSRAEFHAMIGGVPFGQLPVLEVDGKLLTQTMAINRFLARTFGFAGKTLFEAALVDSLGDRYTIYRERISPYYSSVLSRKPANVIKKLKKEVLLPAREKFFGSLTIFLKGNSVNGYLVGDSITWMDVLIAEHAAEFSDRVPEFLDGFPEIEAHMQKVRSTPNLKKWIENRPVTPF
ncbi:glutathione S-transferase protein [Dictyocaulus viviparus]|uniref:glutathione transferase n=1 Tax=Dictyocaulus viviparus TaxID=29172 RepID=A0A0D8XFW1_DICVI|nr:glutathione S-transferase protein [Dictyocaulus viviparus]